MASKGLVFKFSANMKQFRTAMQNATKSIARVGKKMQAVGKSMSTYVTGPILALGAAGVIAWDKQAKAIAQVETGLRTTGNAVGYTSDQLQKMASEMQNNSLFGDEEILKNATAQLLTFTNIAGKQFKRTQQAALDLSVRLDGDLKSAAIQLGKALNDPVANLSALSRSGIQFSEDQKKVINGLVKTNRLAEAQTIILNELEKQYGGSAKAASEAGLGPITQLGNAIGDLSEDYGKIITEALNPFVEKLSGVVKWMGSLSTATKTTILIVGGIVAAIGPLILIVGTFMTMLPVLIAGVSTLAAGFAAINWPIVAAVVAIGTLVAAGVYLYENWDAVKERLAIAWVYIKNAFLDGIVITLKALTFFHRKVAELLGMDFVADGFNFIIEKLEGLKEKIPEVTTEFGSFTEAVLGMKKSVEDAMGSTEKVVEKTTKKAEGLATSYIKVKDTAIEMGVGINASAAMAAAGMGELANEMEVVEQNTIQLGETSKVVYENYVLQLQETAAAVHDFVSHVGRLMGDLFNLISMHMDNQMAKHNINTAAEIKNVDRKVANDVMTNKQGEKEKLKIQRQADQKTRELKRKAWKSEKTAAIVMAAIHGALAVTQALASMPPPGSYVVAGISAGLAAAEIAIIASKPMPAFADGGLVFGPTMGMVGEGVGTTRSNPEVIAPLDKLKNFIGGNKVTDNIGITGWLRSGDIYLSNEKGALSYANLMG